MIENDENDKKKATLANICMCVSVWSQGGMERKLHIELFCCALHSASVILNLYMDKRKKITYQYELDNNR